MMTETLAFEPETAAFVRAVAEGPATENLPIEALRDGYRAAVIANSATVSTPLVSEDLWIETPDGRMEARLLTPPDAGDALLIYVHGGGFAVGDLDSHDRLLRLVAVDARLKLLAIAYRRAPEHVFPAARDDVVAAFRWARANAARLGIDPARIALGGESAGGTHAASAALALVAAGEAPPAALWLLVPALDPEGYGESHRLFATGAGRTAAEFAYLWSLYLPTPELRRLPGAAPLAADLAGLPALVLRTAEFDPARDDGEVFAAKAEAAGVRVDFRREPGLVHQFPEITGLSPRSRQAVVEAAQALASAI